MVRNLAATDMVGHWTFDTEEDARAYMQTLENPASYEVRFNGLCWGVFLISDASNTEEDETFEKFLSSLAF